MYYLGLMSGTSMDGIDVALAHITADKSQLLHLDSTAYCPQLKAELKALCQPGPDEINRLGQADRKVALAFADATTAFLRKHQISPEQIQAIGSHGQTIRHWPEGPHGFSLQIGDGNTLATETGIPVIADFRKKDIALGGQGAPLVPAFHRGVFSCDHTHRAIVNIGGIANVTTLLPRENVRGWDTGPGNTLMDHWCLKHTGNSYDKDGQWAAEGEVNPGLLHTLLQDPYFHQPAPKSTGPEYFNLSWLGSILDGQYPNLAAKDVQATLTQLTATTIAADLKNLSNLEQVFVCGGGALNPLLMGMLQRELEGVHLSTTSALGIDVQGVEAMAFAWLAWAFENRQPGNIPAVTGASRLAILGSLYLP